MFFKSLHRVSALSCHEQNRVSVSSCYERTRKNASFEQLHNFTVFHSPFQHSSSVIIMLENTTVQNKREVFKMKTKKIQWIQIARHLVQLAAFILYPGLFVSIFLSVKDIYTALIGGTFVFSTLAPSIFLLSGTLIITIFLGRFFCGFLCSFGAMGDLLWAFMQHTLRVRIKVPEKLDAVLKYLKYVVLAAVVIFGWTLGTVNFEGTLSPWTVFGFYSSIKSWTTATYLFTIGNVFLIVIIIGSMFVERFFCRYLCPLGGIFTLVSKARLIRIRKNRKKCGNCTLCTAKCSMGIPLYKTDIVSSGECIDCFKCTEVCPKANAAANPTPAVASAIAVAALTGMVYGGDILGAKVAEASAVSQSAVSSGSASSGTASSGTASSGTASSGTASSGTASSGTASSGTASSGTASSGTASSGTASSGSASAGATTGSSDSTAAASADSAASSTGAYTDGTYEGSGTGLRGTTTVKVTVSGGQITSIEVESYQDDSQYFNRAQSTVISEILSSQSINVSTVSGATFSSNGILEAVADALNISFTNPNSSLPSGGHGH